MDLGIRGKTAFVLGAGGGLGSAIAITLAREGANVVLGDVNAQALQKAFTSGSPFNPMRAGRCRWVVTCWMCSAGRWSARAI